MRDSFLKLLVCSTALALVAGSAEGSETSREALLAQLRESKAKGKIAQIDATLNKYKGKDGKTDAERAAIEAQTKELEKNRLLIQSRIEAEEEAIKKMKSSGSASSSSSSSSVTKVRMSGDRTGLDDKKYDPDWLKKSEANITGLSSSLVDACRRLIEHERTVWRLAAETKATDAPAHYKRITTDGGLNALDANLKSVLVGLGRYADGSLSLTTGDDLLLGCLLWLNEADGGLDGLGVNDFNKFLGADIDATNKRNAGTDVCNLEKLKTKKDYQAYAKRVQTTKQLLEAIATTGRAKLVPNRSWTYRVIIARQYMEADEPEKWSDTLKNTPMGDALARGATFVRAADEKDNYMVKALRDTLLPETAEEAE